jgi:hypothetical protein
MKPQKYRKSFNIPLLLCLALLGIASHGVQAATLTVTSNADDGSAGTLRSQIAAAAANDTIEFAAGVTGTIPLTGGELILDKNLTIIGPGANMLTISGNGTGRVFVITTAPCDSGPPMPGAPPCENASAVSIYGLTISGGRTDFDSGIYYGGSIYIDSSRITLSLTDCTLSNNTAYFDGGAIWSFGTLLLTNCTLSNNTSLYGQGGGISNVSGTLTVTNSTINNNTAVHGGAIHNAGTLWVNSSTLSNNRVLFGGGGIFNDRGRLTVTYSTLSHNIAGSGGAISSSEFAVITLSNSTLSYNSAESYGGGVYSVDTSTTVTNSTLSHNTAAYVGGIYSFRGNSLSNTPLTVRNSTFSYNAASYAGGIGGIFNGSGSTLTLGNTILAHSIGDNLRSDLCCDSIAISEGYNLSSDDGGGVLTGPGDQINTDPLLDPNGLQDNGGPNQTIALQSGSPAIDRGKDLSGVGRDQRGQPRPFDNPAIKNATLGDGSDIGAVEMQPAPNMLNVRVTGGGFISGNCGGKAHFSINVWTDSAGQPSGHLDFRDSSCGEIVERTNITNVLVTGNHVTISGRAQINGASYDFIVNVDDNGEPGTADTFKIQVSNPYTNGPQTLGGGNIQIQR